MFSKNKHVTCDGISSIVRACLEAYDVFMSCQDTLTISCWRRYIIMRPSMKALVYCIWHNFHQWTSLHVDVCHQGAEAVGVAAVAASPGVVVVVIVVVVVVVVAVVIVVVVVVVD